MNHSQKIKSRIEINAWYDALYTYRDRDEFSKDTIDAFETDIYVRDGYIEAQLNSKASLTIV